MATLQTTVKLVEGTLTRFNNILSTTTTGNALEMIQFTIAGASHAISANSAGDVHTISTEIGDLGCCVIENQSATKEAYFILGTTVDIGAEEYFRIPANDAVKVYLKKAATALSFASEDTTDVDVKIYVHED